MFQKGDRIELVRMGDDPSPLPPGSTGTVVSCQWQEYFKSYQVIVTWDTPRGLMLVIPPDEARKIA